MMWCWETSLSSPLTALYAILKWNGTKILPSLGSLNAKIFDKFWWLFKNICYSIFASLCDVHRCFLKERRIEEVKWLRLWQIFNYLLAKNLFPIYSIPRRSSVVTIYCLSSVYANPGVELYDYISWWYWCFLKVLFQKGNWQSFSKTSTGLVAPINKQKISNDLTKTNFDISRRKLVHYISIYLLRSYTNIYTVQLITPDVQVSFDGVSVFSACLTSEKAKWLEVEEGRSRPKVMRWKNSSWIFAPGWRRSRLNMNSTQTNSTYFLI